MSLGKIKAFLTLLMVMGAVAYFGGDGTLASFSAQTTNPGSAITSGTLLLSDQVSGSTACLSNGAGSTANNNPSCGAVFTLPNVAPGAYGGIAQVTVKNTGTIDARDLWLSAPSVNTTLSGTVSSGASSLPVASLSGAVVKGQEILVGTSSGQQIFYATANVAASTTATTIPVTPAVATNTWTSSTAVDIRDCYDQVATDVSFNSASGNPLCTALVMYVQEVGQSGGQTGSSSYHYCWYGMSYGDSSGMCYAPISTVLGGSANLSTSTPITALPLPSTGANSTLDGNVKSGDKIVVTSGTNTQTFTASGDTYIGSTSISIQSATPTYAFPPGSTITDLSTDTNGPLMTLDGDSTHTIAKFDGLYETPGGIQMATLTGDGSKADTSIAQLPAGASRTFDIGIFLPAPTGTSQNTIQGLVSTFGLTWHIDQ